ncbi:Hypothetical protein RADP37_05272 [Roseomonas mucosa]|uniref:Dienelactone hydrolase n=1 Tax=Roseomonas mucosa TaxID=207340 RepID=A0A4Y1MUS5_9PROT|nr:hypothetical protein [Roseomonas mucosa]AWV21490.1 Hypothetical protein RADP37_05272 [Roseomonas mucosa]MDT8277342.1 hypothetical protein [Roseomonas mucosa]MDT8356472.1 hypothetical protein [Roseomonas mucosa]MDU7523882.1 hypothetical protein [Roseomonas mucosa]
MRAALLLAAVLALTAAAPASAQVAVEIVALPAPAGLARLLRPVGAAHPPLVILLPEAAGADGRDEAYADALLARGIATLTLGLGEGDEVSGAGLDAGTRPGAAAAAQGWADRAGFDRAAIGVVGFGLGGRRALAEAAGGPVVALYPRCHNLPWPATWPVLILQGALDADGCGALAERPGISLRLLPDAGHGWDVPAGSRPGAPALLPDPAGGERLPAVHDPEATGMAAVLLADWLSLRLRAP